MLHFVGKIFSILIGSDEDDGSTTAQALTSDPELPQLPPPEILQPFGERLWIADGPPVNFYGFSYPTRMVAIRLSNGTSWIWSPIELTSKLADEVELHVGPVRYLVSPNKLHHLFLQAWQERFPLATVVTASSAKGKGKGKSKLADKEMMMSDPEYARDISHVVFGTSKGLFEEVVYFHKASRTAIFADLIQRHDPQDEGNNNNAGIRQWILRASGLVGRNGTAPPELRLWFVLGGHLPAARRALDVVLYEWQPERLVIAHGLNEAQDAVSVIANAFRWIPDQPRECVCFCIPTKMCGGPSIASESVSPQTACETTHKKES